MVPAASRMRVWVSVCVAVSILMYVIVLELEVEVKVSDGLAGWRSGRKGGSFVWCVDSFVSE